jgi:pantothenate synthetase
MNRHIMLGNWRMGRFLTAATIVESLFHFVSALVRYIQQSSARLGFSSS